MPQRANPIAMVLLMGQRDSGSPLSALTQRLIAVVYKWLREFNRVHFEGFIDREVIACLAIAVAGERRKHRIQVVTLDPVSEASSHPAMIGREKWGLGWVGPGQRFAPHKYCASDLRLGLRSQWPVCSCELDWMQDSSTKKLTKVVSCPQGFCCGLQPTGDVRFPEPGDICINMLPFVMGDRSSIPEEYLGYWPLLQACMLPADQLGRVGYLTIHESYVPAGSSQRRGGLHVEVPGVVREPGVWRQTDPRARVGCDTAAWGAGRFVYEATVPADVRNRYLPGGTMQASDASDGDLASDDGDFVVADGTVEGGIYMASTTAGSCRVWNVQIRDPIACVGPLGDVEHMRDALGEGFVIPAHSIYWITDTTPHESLPASQCEYRQFFRLVTSNVSVWYAKHSTPNRLGVQPGFGTRVLWEDKFAASVPHRPCDNSDVEDGPLQAQPVKLRLLEIFERTPSLLQILEALAPGDGRVEEPHHKVDALNRKILESCSTAERTLHAVDAAAFAAYFSRVLQDWPKGKQRAFFRKLEESLPPHPSK